MPNLDPDLRALQEVRDYVERAHAACEAVARYSQEQIDRLCEAMSKAASAAAYDLGRLAVEETGIGRVHYKILKNIFGAEGTWASIKNEKTVGIISRDEEKGVYEVATPAGVIASIVPTTNPTSTAIFKAMIAVKGRNATVISPHPRSRRCIGETVEVMRRAIERAGGPPDLVLSLSNPTLESTGALMKHRKVAMILATGGTGLVHRGLQLWQAGVRCRPRQRAGVRRPLGRRRSRRRVGSCRARASTTGRCAAPNRRLCSIDR